MNIFNKGFVLLKNIFKLGILICVIILSFITFNYIKDKFNHIDTKKLNISLYIDTVDKVSKDKIQVNWKEVAAIQAVKYNKDLSKSNESDIIETSNMFITKNALGKDINYKLLSIDDVLNKLSFDEKDRKKVYIYIQDLRYVGLISSNLKEESSNKKFINELTPEAIELYNKYGILPSVTIGQAVLESGWGKSELSSKSNNLFGIKADKSWSGKKVTMKTSEYYNDTIDDSFRVYTSKSESLKDYGEFLYKNKRYSQQGIFKSKHYTTQLQSIENAGYSTKEDKNGNKVYADLVIKIIKENDLQLIDHKAQLEKSKN